MRWLLLLVAACVPPAAPVVHPSGLEETSCHLAPPPEKTALSWPHHATELTCTAKNAFGDPREICFQPLVGVVQTGAVYTSHDIVCSRELADGEWTAISVKVDMRRDLCALDRGGCVIRSLTQDWPKPLDSSEIVALARSLEAKATMPGRDRPTVAECEALADRWEVSGRDDMIATCIEQSRSTLACLQTSVDLNAARSCVP